MEYSYSISAGLHALLFVPKVLWVFAAISSSHVISSFISFFILYLNYFPRPRSTLGLLHEGNFTSQCCCGFPRHLSGYVYNFHVLYNYSFRLYYPVFQTF